MSWLVETSAGEFVCNTAFRIDGIPSTEARGGIEQGDLDDESRAGFLRLLAEVYQSSRAEGIDVGDVSLDLIWSTHEVSRQNHVADIDLFILIRAIASSQEQAKRIVSTIGRLIHDILTHQKYEFTEVARGQIPPTVTASHACSRAMIKKEAAENLAIPTLEAAYSFGWIPSDGTDFGTIVSSLIEIPDIVIHFQLIGARYSTDDVTILTDYLQKINIASNGVMARGIGQITYVQAESLKNVFQQYYDQRNAPLFTFNIVVRGDRGDVENVISHLTGFLNSDPSHPVSFEVFDVDERNITSSNFEFAPWLTENDIWECMRSRPLQVAGRNVSERFRRLSRIITVSEAAEFFRLPVGSDSMEPGLRVIRSDMTLSSFSEGIVDSSDLVLGKLKSSHTNDIGISLRDLTRHMFVCGTPGSGKSSFSIGLLDRLWRQHHIPFLVIEPAKNEYRALIDLIPDLQVFTPGKEFISPFMFNPFSPPNNVRLSSYKRTLKTAFSAAVSMTTPLDRIFEEAVSNCYSDHGWSDNQVGGEGGETFNISEFISAFRKTFAEIGYVGEASNIGRAGEVRLKGLIPMFDYYGTIPISDILSKPTIIELAAVENPEEKSLFIAMILLSVLSYVNANYSGDGNLKNVILLEEAHVLLDQECGPQEANPGPIAQNLVKRMLAESRAYGLGMIVADQSPRKVGLDVVALTDAKVVFRLVEGNDREIISCSMAMDDVQKSRLTKLRPGEAFTFFGKLDAPEEINMTDYRQDNGIRTWISDEELAQKVSYWKSRSEPMLPYPECSISGLCAGGCGYECRAMCKEVSRRLFRELIGNTHDKNVLRKAILRMPIAILETVPECSSTEKACVNVQFWRMVKYSSKYNISSSFMEDMIARGSKNGR